MAGTIILLLDAHPLATSPWLNNPLLMPMGDTAHPDTIDNYDKYVQTKR